LLALRDMLRRDATSVAYMRRRESRGFFVINISAFLPFQEAHASTSLH
jgi:hypothetical protein